MNNISLAIFTIVSFIIVMVLSKKSSMVSNGKNRTQIRIYRIGCIILFLPEILISFIFRGYPSLNFVYFTIWLTYVVMASEKLFPSHKEGNIEDEKILIKNKNWIGYRINFKTIRGKIFVGSVLTIILVLMAFFVISDFYNPTIKISVDNIKISDLDYSYDFNGSDVRSIELIDDISILNKVYGTETAKYARGKFNIYKYGKSQVYIYKDTNKYIFINLNDTNIIYNTSSEKDTLEEYKKLKSYISNLQKNK
ncbi:hypothetical protein NNC19_08530 [Clostridium sp. SHJSY1]|uniref:hypothetical protein n=1 Tax=Clostridium sp. SHJSY1 TaxID=2942483 RepID=UPI002874354A|nr:hypothetical protein [Clostridium sp. SHJSY1]MDS0525722.1 hypothetical protein [Clostridium sp. SHJSY1]